MLIISFLKVKRKIERGSARYPLAFPFCPPQRTKFSYNLAKAICSILEIKIPICKNWMDIVTSESQKMG